MKQNQDRREAEFQRQGSRNWRKSGLFSDFKDLNVRHSEIVRKRETILENANIIQIGLQFFTVAFALSFPGMLTPTQPE
jgi:hypothetical protein